MSSSEVAFEFAVVVLDVHKEFPDGKPIANGDKVGFTFATEPARSTEYFGLCDVARLGAGTSSERWSGTAYDGKRLAQKIQSRKPAVEHVIFYIHGFNNQPEDVLVSFSKFRTTISAQNPKILPIPVLWACSDSASAADKYFDDKGNAATTGIALGRALASFLRARSDRLRVNFFVHSMGNRVLDYTLSSFADAIAARQLPKLVDSIWSVAGDVAEDIFEGQNSGHHWSDVAKRVCVYHSKFDMVMSLSKFANIFGELRFNRRLGKKGPKQPVPDNVISFDCAAFNQSVDPGKGHSYQLAKPIIDHVLKIVETDRIPPW